MHLLRKFSTKLLRLKNSLLAGITIVFILATSALSYMLEPETFGNWFNALYYVMTTIATVGYGDYYLATVPGKILAMFLYVFGIGLLSLVIGKIIDTIAEFHRRRGEGKMSYYGKDHIIIVNWSKKAQLAIEELLAFDPNDEVVIIDEVEKHPFDHPKVHYVNGDPTSEEILLKAGVDKARSAIIFADPRIDETSLVDGKSLLIASSFERIAPHIHTTVEIMLDKHIQNFRHVRVNEFILSYDAVSRLAVRSALKEGNIDIITQLLRRRHGADIYEVPVDASWRTFRDAFTDLLSKGATLISNKGDMNINRKLDEAIPSDARLFVISDESILAKLTGAGRKD